MVFFLEGVGAAADKEGFRFCVGHEIYISVFLSISEHRLHTYLI